MGHGAGSPRSRPDPATRAEVAYHVLFERMEQGFCVIEKVETGTGELSDFRYVAANPAFERQTGLCDPVGKTIRKLVPDAEPSIMDRYDQVVRTGQSDRFEGYVSALDLWMEAEAIPTGAPGQVAVLFNNISDRKRAEAALREGEAQQAFLLKLSDGLRPLADPAAIQGEACRLLAEWLDVDRAYYVEVDEAAGIARVERDYVRGDAPSIAGKHRVADFAWSVAILRRGECHVIGDTQTSDLVPPADRPACAALQIVACMGAPLIKDGQLVGALCTTASRSRAWTAGEVGLLCEVGERIWAAVERARAEATSRASEVRFRQFAEASSDVLWIRDAETLAMEYVSPAFETVYGVSRDAVIDGGDPRRWAALIVPDDRDAALEHLEQARRGEAVVHEFRIQRPLDGAFRWIRNHDFPLLAEHGQVQRIGGIAQDVTEAKQLAEHQAVLLAELQHRVRNIMAVIRSITARTGERAGSVSEYAALLAGRLMTLARVQALLTRSANAGVSIHTLIRDELAAQTGHEGQHELSGPDIVLSPKAAEVLTLVVHELATNALKYGAFSTPHGLVRVTWQVFEKHETPWLALDWVEQGASGQLPTNPPIPRRRGFGSELIEGRIPYELGGRGKLAIEQGGVRCHLEFPLRDGASILETDAPGPATMFGGSIDMTGEADLTGHRVLVIEDEFYLAQDTARALQGAGAEVLGPCPTEGAAQDELEEGRPTGAVVDIDLGRGPSFALARMLRQQGVAFVFVTGYDEAVIPPEFAGVTRLQKPVELRQVIGTLAEVLGMPPASERTS